MAIDIKLPRVNNFCCCCTLKCGVITIAVVFMGNYRFCMIWVFGTVVFITGVVIILIIASSLRASNRPETAHRLGFLWMGKAVECGLLVYGVIVVNSFAQTLRDTDSPLIPGQYSHVEEPVDV
uniref:Uncharacterized protein n=1 Tax=Branchiostoma floridae TaxID=7739 RepID=C3XY97_BRAFL|eukprot:XP_002610772.1 hypothetical protein BRAFLDRAFT_91564 [Branchiostoma floridae]